MDKHSLSPMNAFKEFILYYLKFSFNICIPGLSVGEGLAGKCYWVAVW